MNPSPPTTLWVSDRHLRIEVDPSEPSAAWRAWRSLQSASLPWVKDIIPGHRSVTVAMDPLVLEPDVAVHSILLALAQHQHASDADSTTHNIPVCYDPPCSPDLAEVASLTGLTTDTVVQLHHAATYHVRYIGFSPGFPYLSGLPTALSVPRLDQPRVRIPAGSVAIAADQAGIYPQSTPGGWRLIGQTPLALFDPARAQPSLLRPGDKVRFNRITLAEFQAKSAQPAGQSP